MIKKKATKRTLFISFVSMFLCFAMLLGTTYAWFTDSVTSATNVITAGNLDVELYHANKGTNGDSKIVDENTVLFTDIDSTKWEPGAMAWEKFTVKNAGDLALKYEFALNVTNATVIDGISFTKMLKVAVVDESFVYSRDNVKAIPATEWKDLDSLSPILSDTAGLKEAEEKTFGVIIWWQPSDKDNLFNMNNGKEKGSVSVNVGVVLRATQFTSEEDSFGSDYDTDSTYPPEAIHFNETLALDADKLENGLLKEKTTVGNSKYIHAVLPEGTGVDGTQLSLKIDSMSDSKANVTLEDGAVTLSYNVRIEGMVSNGKAAIITVPGMMQKGVSELKVELYHVENNVTNAMTRVDTRAEVDAHNEFFYDKTTGDVTMALASFSEVMTVVNPTREEENFEATTNVAPNAEGKVGSDVTVGDTTGDIFAVVPADVQMEDGASALKLTVNPMAESEANVTASNRSEVVSSIDIHIDGVAENNTVPVAITLNAILPTGLNKNNVKLYHVEDGITNEMTLVDTPVNHNEFSYDPATGNVVITIASFSEILVYGDTAAAWDGTVSTKFAGGDGTEADPYIIASGDQLAYFRDQVDAGNTFQGKFVKLTANINLNDINFDPIGFGYDYDGFMKDGKTFNGTFDGNGNTIFGLYQNGWDLDPDKENYSTYTYSMAGGGLFASVVDATIKNLTISGANIVFECVDMGVVVGYAQGNCTFDNIAIVNCTIQNYNRYTGGVVGECSPRYDANGTPLHSNHLFNNIRVDSTTVVSSLWGSFDTSLGGILGGKWDKYGDTTKVTMTNCDVACKIDTFNDVTSAYQWYAYRRAGMLIGNTEQSADHKALANFLTCENVHVYYGEWNNYHYCEFENQSGLNAKEEDVSWQNRYPWVRVESGLSCDAYSNPRYGNPIVNSIAIADSIHGHAGDDQCMISIPFRQLYGGGQGVYGATEHAGVSEGAYTVTYISYAKTVKVEFVADNTEAHTLWDVSEHTVGTSHPDWWENGHGHKVESIPAGNTTNYIVYPKWAEEFTIRFHDAEGNMLYHEHFKEGSDHQLNMTEVNAAINALQTKLDATKRVIIVSWNIEEAKEDYKEDTSKTLQFKGNQETVENIDLSKATADITVHAKYELSTSSITLVPVYDANEVLTHYMVVDAAETIENVVISIPPYVGTVPVASLGPDAFAGFDNLHAVVIPHRITHIGTGALAENWKNGTFGTDKGETITIYYEGTYEEWQKIKLDAGWYYGISENTRIFFMGDDKKVDFDQGYLQFDATSTNWLGAVKDGKFIRYETVPESFISEYNKNCDCNIDGCAGEPRPDATYWQFDTNTTTN